MTPAPRTKDTAYRPRIALTGTRGTYRVESQTHAGTIYTTTAARCTCPAGRWGRACKHSAVVKRLNAAFYAPKAPALRVSSTGTSGMAALQEAFGY